MIPIVDSLLNIALWTFIFRYEPLGFCIEKSNKKGMREQAHENIKKIYKTGNDESTIQAIYSNKVNPEMEEGLVNKTP